MAAKKVKVTYQDGREEIVKVLPRAQYLKGFKSENVMAGTFYLGWAALHVAGKEGLDYETWLNKIDDVEDVEEPVDPTPEAQSVDTSPDSPS